MINGYWYKIANIKFEMIKFTQKREFTIMIEPMTRKVMIRALTLNNVQGLDWLLWNFFHMNEKKEFVHFYYSMATFSFFPRMGIDIPYDLTERKIHLEDWNKQAHKHMTAYDMLIDIDSPDHEHIDFAYYSAKSIKDFLDAWKVPYELRFSGCGFHFVIPHKFFESLNLSFEPYQGGNIYQFYAKIGKYLHENFSEFVDYSIYDSRRVCKIPYTIASYESGDYVCLPFLDNESFINFELNNMKPDNFINMQSRGTRLFNSESKNWNVESFLKKMRIDADEYKRKTTSSTKEDNDRRRCR